MEKLCISLAFPQESLETNLVKVSLFFCEKMHNLTLIRIQVYQTEAYIDRSQSI